MLLRRCIICNGGWSYGWSCDPTPGGIAVWVWCGVVAVYVLRQRKRNKQSNKDEY